MSISNEQMEMVMEQYRVYIDKIINHTYYFLSLDVKEELYQAGLIGLWKGILAYYKNAPENFDNERFIDTICARIRYEMADSCRKANPIRMSTKQWRNFTKVKKLLSKNPDISEEQQMTIVTNAGLRYDWYLKTKKRIPVSLDMTVGEDSDSDMYNFLGYNDNKISHFENQSYVNYIIDSAMYGVKSDRDKDLIRAWLKGVSDKKEPNFTELGKRYEISPHTATFIIYRFIDICRFVRDCESAFAQNPDGIIYFPEIAEKNKTHNGKKIPGVSWMLRYRKWKVTITNGKRNPVYIGSFEKYEDAVKARRDAEIKYRGFSNIEI